jgi:hypothetical protein
MQRPGRHVVCLVVLIVIARRHAWVIGTGVRSGLGLFHVTPSFMGARLAARRSRLHYRAIEDRADVGVTLRSSFCRAATTDGMTGMHPLRGVSGRESLTRHSADVRVRSGSVVGFCGGVR